MERSKIELFANNSSQDKFGVLVPCWDSGVVFQKRVRFLPMSIFKRFIIVGILACMLFVSAFVMLGIYSVKKHFSLVSRV